MRRFGLALLVLASCSSPPESHSFSQSTLVPQDVVWTNLVNCIATGSSVVKSGGMPQVDDAGATTMQQIASGDGWLEFTASETQAFRFAGLTHQHSGTTAAEIDFAFRLQSGRADIYENGQWRADNLAQPGDVLRVAAEAGHIKFYKNGVAVYTSGASPKYPLFGDAALIDPNAGVAGAKIASTIAPLAPSGGFVSALSAQATADGAQIAWTTIVPASSQLEYGTDTTYGHSAGDAALASTHNVSLSGLSGATVYHFRVRSADAAGDVALSPDQTFTTLAPAAQPNRHRFCGWTEATGYVTPDQDPGYLTFAAHADEFDAVHPMWWHVTGSSTFASIYGEGSSLILDNTTYAGKRTLLIPTIAAADGSDPQTVSNTLHDAGLRAQHVAAIRALVNNNHYDGIDLDYEHLPSSDRDSLSQLARELGQALHADGHTLSFAVDGETFAYGLYDYVALSQAADQLHVMGYDYHWLGGSHPGPVAPLGWIQDVCSYIGTTGAPSKFILGLPNYGIGGPDGSTTNWAGSSMDAINLSGGNYQTTTNHMSQCSYVDPSQPIAPGRAPNAETSQGHVFFDDLASMEEKVITAQNANLGGITYWTIGGEPDRPGPLTFFQMVRGHFPK